MRSSERERMPAEPMDRRRFLRHAAALPFVPLAGARRKYDPDGLFFIHHGVGSEAWSADGFTPQTGG